MEKNTVNNIQPGAQQPDPKSILTSNEIAANGPSPGDVSLYAKELVIATKYTSHGYYPSLNAAEIADAQRSGFFPAASFTGSFDGPNQVYAWRSEDSYQGLTYIVNRKPGELYLVGGDYPPPTGPVPPAPLSRRPTPPRANRFGAPTSTTPTFPAVGSAMPT